MANNNIGFHILQRRFKIGEPSSLDTFEDVEIVGASLEFEYFPRGQPSSGQENIWG